MCFSLVYACLSVSLGDGSQEPCPITPHPYLPAPHWKQPKDAWSPSSEGARRKGCSTLAPESYMCVWVCMCMYVHREPVCNYIQRERGSLSQRLGQVGLLEARPARTASSQVDPPQVSRRCDGVALRAELLGTQSPQPALFTVHMPTLDRR